MGILPGESQGGHIVQVALEERFFSDHATRKLSKEKISTFADLKNIKLLLC